LGETNAKAVAFIVDAVVSVDGSKENRFASVFLVDRRYDGVSAQTNADSVAVGIFDVGVSFEGSKRQNDAHAVQHCACIGLIEITRYTVVEIVVLVEINDSACGLVCAVLVRKTFSALHQEGAKMIFVSAGIPTA
jgi:hypothetical protein